MADNGLSEFMQELTHAEMLDAITAIDIYMQKFGSKARPRCGCSALREVEAASRFIAYIFAGLICAVIGRRAVKSMH